MSWSASTPGVSLKIALYALLRFHILTTACLGTAYSRHLLLGLGLLSMFLAVPFILVQRNLKRICADGRLAATSSTLPSQLVHRRYRPKRGYLRDGQTIRAIVGRAGLGPNSLCENPR